MALPWQLLLQIYIPTAIQLSSYSLVAWICLKRRGGLPFELAGCFAIGAIVVVETAAMQGFPNLLSQFLGASAALAMARASQELWRWWGINRDVFGIIFSLCALVIFDLFTDASPVSVLYPGAALFSVSFIAIAVLLLMTRPIASGAFGAQLRLGETYRWASEAWLRESPIPFALLMISFLSWGIVLSIPIYTTGVASQTIFRDTTVAVLIAKAVGVRPLFWLPAIGFGAVTIRIATTYALAGPFGTVAGDLAVILLLAIAIAFRGRLRTN